MSYKRIGFILLKIVLFVVGGIVIMFYIMVVVYLEWDGIDVEWYFLVYVLFILFVKVYGF